MSPTLSALEKVEKKILAIGEIIGVSFINKDKVIGRALGNLLKGMTVLIGVWPVFNFPRKYKFCMTMG